METYAGMFFFSLSLARTETSTHGNDAEPEGHREAHCWLARGLGPWLYKYSSSLSASYSHSFS
jgi:hypothetical protein